MCKHQGIIQLVKGGRTESDSVYSRKGKISIKEKNFRCRYYPWDIAKLEQRVGEKTMGIKSQKT